jgi:MinD superfamily P-loop ATPase
MQIAVASGKGGTGKTTVSVNLCYFIEKFWNRNVQLVDCDVEEPNDAFFFTNRKLETSREVFQMIPEIDVEKCTYCKKCEEWCEFNAITIVPKLKFAEVNTTMCHSCGACLVACKFGAISEKEVPLGTINSYYTGIGRGMTEGRLEVGSAMQTLLIKKLKKELVQKDCITILDAPPGTSCPVVETVTRSDYVVLVSEPTPFGLHDLKITVDLLDQLNIPYGVIINKAGLGSDDIYGFLNEKEIELLGKIPYNRKYAGLYSSGRILDNISDETANVYKTIIEKIKARV